MATSFTAADLTSLEEAMAQGVLAVTFADGRQVTFSSFQELVNRWHFIAQALGEEGGRRRMFAEFKRGVVP
jgi:hypothetical protein